MNFGIKDIKIYIKLLRFQSFFGWQFIFSLGSILFGLPLLENFILIFFSFFFISASIFVLNQYFDYKRDKKNILKQYLPISSGRISQKKGLIFFFCLISLGFLLIIFSDTGYSVLPYMVIYSIIGICYSSPPYFLKNRPIIDLLSVGFAAGVLPFIIGLQVSNQLTLEFSLPWIQRRYINAFLCSLPLFLFQIAMHLYHTIGDYEADLITNVKTSVVKYGKKKSIKIANIFIIICPILLLFKAYYSLDSFQNPTNLAYLISFLCFFPAILYIMNKLRDTSTINNSRFRNIIYILSSFIIIISWLYIFSIRIQLF